MRGLAAIGLIALCIASAALAQTEQAPPPAEETLAAFEPDFVPTEQRGRGVTSIYPRAALEREISGLVHLCCTIAADRTLACQVALEWPDSAGFGRTALRYVGGRVVTEESYAAWQARGAPAFQYPMLWAVLPMRPEFVERATRVHREATDLCGPGTGRPPNYVTITAQAFTRVR